ncbi:hypothetical protein [Egicoccus halophilus]|uniref:Uncharacterized protein n=1 Tax=Egicoccus halophilus TaxID=1670830 RepID=A0A8J3EVD8_9ACTN|nr:hypothetical protein [Egicoccus halophilus]GGI09499.1 hypothetical protein GCM10011354_34380 [Egicoccus halophilus]
MLGPDVPALTRGRGVHPGDPTAGVDARSRAASGRLDGSSGTDLAAERHDFPSEAS